MTPTAAQQEVIDSKADTVIVIAGPGSGKTETLTRRYIATAAESAHPNAIITFTNAGAKTFRERILSAGGTPPAYCSTLHSFCLALLTSAGYRLTVLDEATSEALLLECAKDVKCNYGAKALRAAVMDPDVSGVKKTAVQRYRRALKMANSTDYDLLLVDALEHIRERGGPRLGHLMVDEAQDGAAIDADIYRALTCDRRTFVGDFDQQIYSFRGADPQSLRSFMPGAHVIRMEENFRSDVLICEAAQRLIAKDKARFEKATVSMTGRHGHVGLLCGAPFADDVAEIAGIVAFCAHVKAKRPDSTLAILCRYNRTRIDITRALQAAGVIAAQTASKPRDWQFALLSLQAWQDPENILSVKAWLRGKHGETIAGQMIDSATQTRRAPSTGLEGLPLPVMMERANLSRHARDIINDAAEGTTDAGQILLRIREADRDDEGAGNGGNIRVMSCHRSKGQEFDAVIIPACETDIFKPWEAEERRVFFVSMTRARKALYFSYARNRCEPFPGGRSKPAIVSEFLADCA
jgi:DNA helicase-2/ATP-dependent DNA helicase PcrA